MSAENDPASTTAPGAKQDGDANALSYEQAIQAWTDHIGDALGKHADRAVAARNRASDPKNDAVAMQRDLIDFTTQVWADSLRSLGHFTRVVRSATEK